MTHARARTAEIRPDRELNCRGMRCPLPVIYARKTLALMDRGEVLRVVATDPGSALDIVEFSRQNHIELVTQSEAGGDWVFLLRKRDAAGG